MLAVEFFVAGGRLLTNELAARPHNSAHYTIEGCVTSQFEIHLRAVCDLPLGSAALTAPAVATVNIFGPDDGSDPTDTMADMLTIDGAHVTSTASRRAPDESSATSPCARRPATTRSRGSRGCGARRQRRHGRWR